MFGMEKTHHHRRRRVPVLRTRQAARARPDRRQVHARVQEGPGGDGDDDPVRDVQGRPGAARPSAAITGDGAQAPRTAPPRPSSRRRRLGAPADGPRSTRRRARSRVLATPSERCHHAHRPRTDALLRAPGRAAQAARDHRDHPARPDGGGLLLLAVVPEPRPGPGARRAAARRAVPGRSSRWTSCRCASRRACTWRSSWAARSSSGRSGAFFLPGARSPRSAATSSRRSSRRSSSSCWASRSRTSSS